MFLIHLLKIPIPPILLPALLMLLFGHCLRPNFNHFLQSEIFLVFLFGWILIFNPPFKNTYPSYIHAYSSYAAFLSFPSS